MPINYKDYPDNWKWLSAQIKARAKNHCELCNAENGKPHWKTKSIVVLTVHYINFNIKDNHPLNLLALCQRCHLRLDIRAEISKHDLEHLKGKFIVKIWASNGNYTNFMFLTKEEANEIASRINQDDIVSKDKWHKAGWEDRERSILKLIEEMIKNAETDIKTLKPILDTTLLLREVNTLEQLKSRIEGGKE